MDPSTQANFESQDCIEAPKACAESGCELGAFAPKAPSEKYGVGFRLEKQLRTGSQVIYINKYGNRFMNESRLLSHRKDLFKVQDFDHDRAEYPKYESASNVPEALAFGRIAGEHAAALTPWTLSPRRRYPGRRGAKMPRC